MNYNAKNSCLATIRRDLRSSRAAILGERLPTNLRLRTPSLVLLYKPRLRVGVRGGDGVCPLTPRHTSGVRALTNL